MCNSILTTLTLILICFIFQGQSLSLHKREATTCCSGSFEVELKNQSRIEFNSMIKDASFEVFNIFSTKVQKFDGVFKDLIKKSKSDFHKMFLATYGLLYERYAHIFKQIFTNFETYYSKGNIDMSEAFNNFFQVLYRTMFQVLNSQYLFDNKYLECASRHMDELKPFGDAPQKLIIEVKRSFIATHVFVQSLIGGSGIIKSILEIPQTTDCYSAVMNMKYCPLCKGVTGLKPCKDYCHTVTRKCLVNFSSLDKEWNNYIDALIQLIGRLETSFNIESVVGPIDIKISEAIMNFQDNGDSVSKKIFETCGKPIRKKRAVNSNGIVSRSSYNHHEGSNDVSSHMEELLKDIKRRLKRVKDIWSQLHHDICNLPSLHDPLSDNKNCWNGTGFGITNFKPYEESISLASTLSNTKQIALIAQQSQSLKLYVIKLNSAFNGLEANSFEPVESEMSEGSGSGSGNGEDEDDEDDNEYYNNAIHTHTSSSTEEDIYFNPSTSSIPILEPENIDNLNNNLDILGPESMNSMKRDARGSSTCEAPSFNLSILIILTIIIRARVLL